MYSTVFFYVIYILNHMPNNFLINLVSNWKILLSVDPKDLHPMSNITIKILLRRI